jgi:hypothetical protein
VQHPGEQLHAQQVILAAQGASRLNRDWWKQQQEGFAKLMIRASAKITEFRAIPYKEKKCGDISF